MAGAHYDVELLKVFKPEKVAEVLNQRWEQGWRLAFMYRHDAGLLITFERVG